MRHSAYEFKEYFPPQMAGESRLGRAVPAVWAADGRIAPDELSRRHSKPPGDGRGCEWRGRGGPWRASSDRGPSGGARGCTTERKTGRIHVRLRSTRTDRGGGGNFSGWETVFRNRVCHGRLGAGKGFGGPRDPPETEPR